MLVSDPMAGYMPGSELRPKAGPVGALCCWMTQVLMFWGCRGLWHAGPSSLPIAAPWQCSHTLP